MIVALIFTVIVGPAHTAELLRTPKVYNALITTDQNLTPSRAYPVIRPTVHDSPFVYSPYNFSPYGFYDPFAFNEFGGNAQSLFSRYNGNAQTNRAEIANNQAAAAQASAASAAAVASNSVGNDRSFVVNRSQDNRNAIGVNDKSPIPLNEFGLPPSLVPVAPYGNINQSPVDLAPYNYNSYPLIFDQFGGFQQGPYLPHFGNVPQDAYTAFGGPNRPSGPNGNGAFGNAAVGAAGFGNAAGGASGFGNAPGRISGFGNAPGGVPGFGNAPGGLPVNGFGPGALNDNRAQLNGDIGNRNVIGLPGTSGGAVQAANEQVSFNRDNLNRVNGAGAQRADFVQSSSSHGAGSDGQTSSSESSFQQSSLSASTVSSASSSGSDGGGIVQTSGGLRKGRIFYFSDDIKNNRNLNGNIVDASPSRLPFQDRTQDEQ